MEVGGIYLCRSAEKIYLLTEKPRSSYLKKVVESLGRLVGFLPGRRQFGKVLRRLLFIGTSCCTVSVRTTTIEKLTLACNQVSKSKFWRGAISPLVKILTDRGDCDVKGPLKSLQLHVETYLSPFTLQKWNSKANISKGQIIFEFLWQFLKKVRFQLAENVKK